ncbi:sarcosine oxidase subunit gamma [Yoonia algicola]|uniref:Sarcosine oxidase subunit gamma n=1 Tax=Yoonia algicola TaxID=3137368 RepID=A0AAN0NDU3_9RHOB
MASLIALTPCAGLLPIVHGGVEVSEVVPDRLMSVAPYRGQHEAVAAQLKAQVGVGLSAPKRRAGCVTWFGHGTWLVAGEVALDGAAVTDQSDAWAVVHVSGAGVEDVLARLVPVDLRGQVFKTNHVAKTLLGHMAVTIIRSGADRFEIMAMRSMAKTLVHDLDVAMRALAMR